jgi:hypothetical protein
MTETPESEARRKSRLRWITLGEAIAIAALVISAVGVWISWKSDDSDQPTTVVEKRTTVPLVLRGKIEDDGKTLAIAPAESEHSLQTLMIKTGAGVPIEVGSDGALSASEFQTALGDKAPEIKGTTRMSVRITANYVEAGADKSATGSYVIAFRWESGGLFGGRSLRFVGFSR